MPGFVTQLLTGSPAGRFVNHRFVVEFDSMTAYNDLCRNTLCQIEPQRLEVSPVHTMAQSRQGRTFECVLAFYEKESNWHAAPGADPRLLLGGLLSRIDVQAQKALGLQLTMSDSAMAAIVANATAEVPPPRARFQVPPLSLAALPPAYHSQVPDPVRRAADLSR